MHLQRVIRAQTHGYAARMASNRHVLPRSAFATVALGLLAACDGTTGGYPPAPPPYQAPAAALEAATTPKFQPLVKALIEQRNAAKALAHASASGGESTNYQELFGKSREASKGVAEAVLAANLTAEEKSTWDSITSLDDAQLVALVK